MLSMPAMKWSWMAALDFGDVTCPDDASLEVVSRLFLTLPAMQQQAGPYLNSRPPVDSFNGRPRPSAAYTMMVKTVCMGQM